MMMDRKNLFHENEKLLFHGANAHSTCAISETGFSRNTCGNHDTRYGIGVYFSKSAEYAEKSALPSDTGILKIFLARVLVGYSVETTQGQLAIVQEPNSSRTYDSGKAPDSNEDGIVVIFTDSQAYPEYVITSKIHSSDTQTTSP
ncbi:protein mono-ADP-ribosyltransferase PARP15-like [Physella acuta]|uniref:protein mono-ADP-ribosyltransferase PARP15-like n=1 Tax=Physella acuta TaxID=109671 RepID=UPI0027DE4F9D|nr:protein mono-ADP-ribosyltransferase PARP15-like [Physella acuta]